MRPSHQTILLRRFTLWVLGQALPEPGALRKPARVALLSIVVAAAAGTLAALGIVAALIGLYMFMLREGMGEGVSLMLVSGVGMALAALAYLIARQRVETIPDHFDELQLFGGQPKDLLGELANLVMGGFVEGLSDKSAEEKLKAEKDRNEIALALEELTARLALLEKDGETDFEADVVFEIDRKRS